MKVSVRFEGTGLQLRLVPETEVEQRMVGAVLNHQPENDSMRGQVESSLVSAEVSYEGHHTHNRVNQVVLTVHRQEQPT